MYIITLNPNRTAVYNAPTVSNHAGFVSVKLDHFCYFGAELNFFEKL